LDADKACRYAKALALGEAGTKVHLRAIDVIRTHGYGMATYKFDPDIELATAAARRRTEAARRNRGAADDGGNQGDIGGRQADHVPAQDLRPVFRQMQKEITEAGGLTRVETKQLLQYLAFALKTDFAIRGTGLANLPLYHFRREPARATLVTCTKWWIAIPDTKEIRLRKMTGWSDEIMCSQDPAIKDDTRSSALMTEYMRRLEDTATGGRPFPTLRKLYNRPVYLDNLFVKRLGAATNDNNKWDFGTKLKPATIHKYITDLTGRVAMVPGFDASHLRHLHATYLCHAWVLRKKTGFRMEDLRDRMRHSDQKTTRRHYVRKEMHPDVVRRWEALTYQKVLKLTTSAILRH
jgi:hypothetical protein